MKRSSTLVIYALCAGSGSLVSDVNGQPVGVQRWYSVDGKHEVVAPENVSVPVSFVASLFATGEGNPAVRGLPRHLLAGRTITLSLATDVPADVDSRAEPSTGVIAIPLPRALSWSTEHLSRVYRHELAHIALWHLFSTRRLPAWLREGLPEFAEGGLSCRQRAQLSLDINARQRLRLPLPRLTESLARTELSYAYYATVLEYLDEKSAGAVSSGTWVAQVAASELVFFWPEGSYRLEHEWHEYLREKYRALEGSRCVMKSGVQSHTG